MNVDLFNFSFVGVNMNLLLWADFLKGSIVLISDMSIYNIE